MRSDRLGLIGIFALALCAFADAQQPTRDAVRSVLKSMSGSNLVNPPILSTTPEGYLKFIAAPAGNVFDPGPAAKAAGTPDGIAKSFLSDYAGAFGIHKDGVSFATDRVQTQNARTFVRLNQLYEGIPVFGGQVNVQMQADGGVTAVLSDVMRDASRVYSGALSLTPGISPGASRNAAMNVLQGENPGYQFGSGEATLYIYVPSVVGAVGVARLAYEVEVYGTGDGIPVEEKLLIDAHTGGVIIRIPQILYAKDRQIYDAANTPFSDTFPEPGTFGRGEGDPASGISDVNDAYDFYGDTYDFYSNEHGRDSIDGAGMTMEAITRYCPDNIDCPYSNAFWRNSSQRMYFGDGFVVDDVVGHELTHGVTSHESGLIYFSESGAINESFSDIWGEYIDLTNGKGLDTTGVRWRIGEEVFSGGFRSMSNPPLFACAEIYQGPFWIFDLNFDNGGVHFNSGVGNKICYLLTDGDTFNGFTVAPLGMQTVAELFYECQINLLNVASDYSDLGNALVQAANNLGLSIDEIAEINEALFATEIKKFEGLPLRHFRAGGQEGDNRVALTWRVPTVGDYTGVDIVRRVDRFPTDSTDGVVVASITDSSEIFVDTPGGSAGTDVFYGLFPRPGTYEASVPLFARGTIGVTVDYLTERFTDGSDMSLTQITYVPTGPVPVTGAAVDKPEAYFNYTTYAAHVSSDAKINPLFDGTLPVDKEGAFQIALGDDDEFTFSSPIPIPFFGRFINSLTLSSNGYIATAASQYADSGSATLEDHFEEPRISFLYSDLDPRSGGEVWAKIMDDRVVVTFEDVPSFDKPNVTRGGEHGNTVQCELFVGGQIRCTYLGLTTERAIIGLSDGNGIPLEVVDVLSGNPADPHQSNLDELPKSIPLELQPIPVQYVERGDVVRFTANAITNQGAVTYSSIPLPAVLGVGEMLDATLDSSTGEFEWATGGFAQGVYGMVLCASAGEFSSCQTVGVVVTRTDVVPRVIDVTLNPEDPRDSQNLVGDYTYVHPTLPEGPTTIYWLRNGSVIPAFTNQLTVTDDATSPGEEWCFQIVPSTIQVGSFGSEFVYLLGEMVQSPKVTILPDLKVDTNGDGKVNSVDVQLVVRGLLGVGDAGVDPDVNGDGREDASDIQSTINFILTKREN